MRDDMHDLVLPLPSRRAGWLLDDLRAPLWAIDRGTVYGALLLVCDGDHILLDA